MDTNSKQAVLVLIAALVAGAAFQQLASAEATTLGLSTLELALLGTAAGVIGRRAMS